MKRDEILIISEVPGLMVEGITFGFTRGAYLEIVAVGKNRKYRKEVLLPVQVKKEPFYTYKNGILEIWLRECR